MDREATARDVLNRECEQAWAQSRHLETMRSQYLGFFFTAVLAVVALAGPRVADAGLRTSASLATIAALAFGLHLLSAFLFLAVRRMNVVLNHYTKRIISLALELKAGLPIRQPNQGAVRPPVEAADAPRVSRLASPSGSSRDYLAAGVVVFPFVLAASLAAAIAEEVAMGVCLGLGAALALSLAVLIGTALAVRASPPTAR